MWQVLSASFWSFAVLGDLFFLPIKGAFHHAIIDLSKLLSWSLLM
jgi:hypothetical protein